MDGYTDLDTRVTTNANGIAALEGQLANTNTNVSNNTTEIGKINTEITTDLKPRIEALEGADEVIEGVIAGHTTAIQTLNETTIPALQGAIETEAKARDDADKAILTKIGDVATGKTVVDLINEVAGTIDFSPYAKKDEVAATYATIAALEAETARADAAEKANAKAITDLTNGAVKDNTDAIAALDATLKAALENDGEGLDSIKELATWIEEHETEVLPVIDDQSKRLAEAEAILAGIGGEGEKATVKSYVDDAIAAIPAYELPMATAAALGGVKSAADVEGKAAVNKVYVDATTGIGEVKAFSTDNLVQGSMTIILNGGDVDIA
jgi:chromosome segregation ATPase